MADDAVAVVELAEQLCYDLLWFFAEDGYADDDQIAWREMITGWIEDEDRTLSDQDAARLPEYTTIRQARRCCRDSLARIARRTPQAS